MWNFEDNLSDKGFIIRYTRKTKRGLFFFIILWSIFYISNMLGEKEKTKIRGERAREWHKQALWLVDFFFETVIGPGLDGLSCQMNSRNAP